MGENKVMNLFEQAIERDELLQFALGQKEYFMLDREYDENWVHGSWVNYILPYINSNNENIINQNLEKLFKSILNS